MPSPSVVTHSVSEFLSRLASGRRGSRRCKVRFSHCPSTAHAFSSSTGLCQGGNSPPATSWPLSFIFPEQASLLLLLLGTATFLGSVQVYQERVAIPCSPLPSSTSHSCRRECHPWAQAGILNSPQKPLLGLSDKRYGSEKNHVIKH